jgi:predicted nucleotidyltransferase
MVLSQDILTQTRQILEQVPDIVAAYLHGSTIKGTQRPDSDVDIAILPMPGTRIPLKARLECAAALENIFHRPVDIGELSTRNLIYSKEVIAASQEIFTHNSFISGRFMATCLAMYAELQQQRKEVLDAYST